MIDNGSIIVTSWFFCADAAMQDSQGALQARDAHSNVKLVLVRYILTFDHRCRLQAS